MANYFERANALYAIKRYDAAIEAYYQHLAIDPNCILSRVNIAAALIKLKRTSEAAAILGETLALAPDFAFAHYLRSFTEENAPPDSPAQAAIEEAIRLEQRADYFLRLSSLLLESNRTQESLDAVNQGIELAPRHARGFLYKAEVLQRLGRNNDAHAALNQALALAPEDPDIRLALGKATLSAGLAAEAIDHLHEARRISPVEHNDQQIMAEAYGRDMGAFRPLNAVQKAYLNASPMLQWTFNASIATAVILFLKFMPRETHQEQGAVFLLLALGFNLILAVAFFDIYAGILGLAAKRRSLDLSWLDAIGSIAGATLVLFLAHVMFSLLAFAFSGRPEFAFTTLTIFLVTLLFNDVDRNQWTDAVRTLYPVAVVSLIGFTGYGFFLAIDGGLISLTCWFFIVAITGLCTYAMK